MNLGRGLQRRIITGALCLLAAGTIRAQQVPDTDFSPAISKPAYAADKGPRVGIDGGHHNFHTAEGRYQTFAKLLSRDGYRVGSAAKEFSTASLGSLDILVISNALHESNAENWAPPNPPAFTEQENDAVESWVRRGGSLLLIVDHQPFPGAAEALAARFGVEFKNAYVFDGPEENRQGSLIFRNTEGSLREHEVTTGIESVANFGGSAFQVAGEHSALLRLSPAAVAARLNYSKQPADFELPEEPIGGWLQGALLQYGKGRIAVFAEAAMFSAQLAGPERHPMGMNAPQAKGNAPFLLNVLHWLSRSF